MGVRSRWKPDYRMRLDDIRPLETKWNVALKFDLNACGVTNRVITVIYMAKGAMHHFNGDHLPDGLEK